MGPSVVGSLVLAVTVGFLPAQQIVGTYGSNDLEGLRGAVASDPQNAGLHIRLAQALLRVGTETAHPDAQEARLLEAQSHFKRVLEMSPNAQVPLRILTLDAYATRRFDQAVTYGERLLAQVPADINVARCVLKSQVRLGHLDEAVAFLVNWFEKGTVPSIGVLQGLVSTLGLNPEFRSRFETAMKAAEARRAGDVQFDLYRVIYLAEIGRTDEAWRILQGAEARGLCDLRSGARHTMARTLLGRGIEPNTSVASYPGVELVELEKCLAAAPEHVGLILRRARVLDLAGRDADALAAFDAALELNPRLWTALYRKGEVLMRGGRAADAIAPLSRALAIYPELTVVLLLEVRARIEAGQASSAIPLLIDFATDTEPVADVQSILSLLATKDPKAMETFLTEIAAARAAFPANPYLAAAAAEASLAAGKTADARAAALDAERLGLSGPEAFPNRLLFRAFGETLPKELQPEPVSTPSAEGR